jgi:hypothetical protein
MLISTICLDSAKSHSTSCWINLSSLFTFTEIQKKKRSDLTLIIHGESHAKGFPEDTDMKASEGVLCPLGAFLDSFQPKT